ncbi:unnamed protein product, partial [Ectocarpus sp. 12 AP-2014]
EATLRTQLSLGVKAEFALSEHIGVITLYSGNEQPTNDALVLECQHGQLALSRAGQVLSLINDCPVTVDNGLLGEEWFWEIYNEYLPDELQGLLGYLRPVMNSQGLIGSKVTITLLVSVGTQKILTCLEMGAPTLERLLDVAGWLPLRSPLYPRWPLKVPLVLGYISLTVAQLKHLREGDAVVPDIAYFKPDGTGVLSLGKQAFGVNFTPFSASIEIINLEENFMHEEDNQDVSEQLGEDSDFYEEGINDENVEEQSLQNHPDDNDQMVAPAFDHLMLNLTVRCGSISLTLGTLGNLQEGSILPVEGCQAGHADLYHDDSLVARGELVSIEGKLGIQVTKLYMDITR